jgi:hypothetical protein
MPRHHGGVFGCRGHKLHHHHEEDMADNTQKTLTPEQEARIPEFRKTWIDIGHDTTPTDRNAAEAAMRECYKAADVAQPTHVLWFGSFAAGAVAAAYLSKIDANLPGLVEKATEVSARFIGGERPVTMDGITVTESDVSSMLEVACYGQHDASWLGFYDYFEKVVGIDASPIHGLMDMARHAGWWWPFEGGVVLTEKPTSIKLDERLRLHSVDGPAVEYPDGYKVYCYHGIQVKPDVILSPKSITPDRIDGETNAEMRRVLLERFGLENYLKTGGAVMIHSDPRGKLWKKDVKGDDPVVMVEVLNSTPEPDGTIKTYMIPVPPDSRTASGAIAWTFGMTESEYVPVVET